MADNSPRSQSHALRPTHKKFSRYLSSSAFCAAIFLVIFTTACTPHPAADDESNVDPSTPQGQTAQKIQTVLDNVKSNDKDPNTDAIATQLRKAGVSTEYLEIQKSTTPTGLQVDSLTLAVPIENECVFGYVRKDKTSTAVLPKLKNGKCFVGDQR